MESAFNFVSLENIPASKNPKMKKEWAGELTEERLKEVIAENARIQATPEARSRDIQQNNIAYSQRQGHHAVCTVCTQSSQYDCRIYEHDNPVNSCYNDQSRCKLCHHSLPASMVSRKDQLRRLEKFLQYYFFTKASANSVWRLYWYAVHRTADHAGIGKDKIYYCM